MIKKIRYILYEKDWAIFDGPQKGEDFEAFKAAINHKDYIDFNLDIECDDHWGNSYDVKIVGERLETEEETKKRYAANKKRDESTKNAAKTKKRNARIKRRELFEELKIEFSDD